jgi:hypothetical protein
MSVYFYFSALELYVKAHSRENALKGFKGKCFLHGPQASGEGAKFALNTGLEP